MGVAQRKLKEVGLPCPNMIFYNNYIGGVDLTDQKVATYDFNRISSKWWRIFFIDYLCLLLYINCWVLHQEIRHKTSPLLQFLLPLAEQMVSLGKAKSAIKKGGPILKHVKSMNNVGEHLPMETSSRRRYCRRGANGTETRTKTIRSSCNFALCKLRFLPNPV